MSLELHTQQHNSMLIKCVSVFFFSLFKCFILHFLKILMTCRILIVFLSPFFFVVISIAAACYTIHYAKRLYETLFIHRFSHATMPLMNLFKNCTYYWGFTAYVAYHVCHPLYTPPSALQTYIGLGGFAVFIS